MTFGRRTIFAGAVALLALVSWLTSSTRAGADDVTPLALDSQARKSGPMLSTSATFTMPPVHFTVLDNGVRILLVERHEVPIVALRVVTMRGTSDAPPAVGALAAAVMMAATTARSAGEISAAMRKVGAITQSAYTYDAISVNADLLSSRLSDVLSLIGEGLQFPQLPVETLESSRATSLARLAEQARDPYALARSTINASLYPASHPYRGDWSGDQRAIETVTREQVISFFQTQVQPDTTVVVVAGDVERVALEGMARRVFGNWKGRAVPRASIPDVTSSSPGPRVVLIDRWGGMQATVTVAQLGIGRRCPDRDALMVINAMLGARSGRLATQLRETRGSTYDARTSFELARGPRPFVLTTSVAPEKVGETTSLMLTEVRRIVSEPVTADDLAYGKAVVRSAVTIPFTSLRGTVQFLSDLEASERPLEDYVRLSESLASITPETILRVAKKYLRPDAMRVFVVAQASKVKGQLESLGLGRVAIERIGDGIELDLHGVEVPSDPR